MPELPLERLEIHSISMPHPVCILMAFATTLHLRSADATLSCKPVQPVTRGGRDLYLQCYPKSQCYRF